MWISILRSWFYNLYLGQKYLVFNLGQIFKTMLISSFLFRKCLRFRNYIIHSLIGTLFKGLVMCANIFLFYFSVCYQMIDRKFLHWFHLTELQYSIKTRSLTLVQCVCIVLCHFITCGDRCNHYRNDFIQNDFIAIKISLILPLYIHVQNFPHSAPLHPFCPFTSSLAAILNSWHPLICFMTV